MAGAEFRACRVEHRQIVFGEPGRALRKVILNVYQPDCVIVANGAWPLRQR